MHNSTDYLYEGRWCCISGYLISLIGISALVGVSSYLSYGGSQDKTAKAAVSIILVYVIVTPVLHTLSSFSVSENYFDYENITDTTVENSELHTSAKEAFENGIKRLVIQKYSAKEGEVSVIAFGFDVTKMKAEKIKIILVGASVMLDNRSMSAYITELGLGECEVELHVK